MDDWKLQPARDLGLTPLERARSPRRESGLVSSSIRQLWWATLRSYFAIWHRLTIHGRGNLPETTPFILAANHTSHLDALVLSAALPWNLRHRVFSLAAGDVFFESPFTSVFAANLLNALPVWRKKRADRSFHTLRQRLIEEECGFILFPEGARSRDGRMAPFKPGIGLLVAGTSAPVIPCHLSGCLEALPPGCALPRRRQIHLRVGPAIRFDKVGNDKEGWRTVAATLEAAIVQLRPN
jgi:1-acyl-sn-glycerol-3-phosphate acyltransferase